MIDDRAFTTLEQTLREMGSTAVFPPMPDPTDAVLRAIAGTERRRPIWMGRLAARPLLLAILLSLLVVGIAAAAYLIATTWLSSAPRGIQYSNEFSFTEVWRDDGPFYSDFALDADGQAVYALRQADPQQPQAVLSRLTGLQDGQVTATDVLTTDDLLDPALWDPGTDLAGMRVGSWYANARNRITVAPDGGVFLLLGAWSAQDSPRLEAATIVRWQPGGSAQRVVGGQELPALVQPDFFGQPLRISIAASAPDRLWISLIGQAGNEGNLPPELAVIVDPNADGDWSDRKVHLPTLPAMEPFVADPDGIVRWFPEALVAEPSVGGVDRSNSILYPALSFDGTYRVVRVSMSGEGEVVFEQEVGLHDGPQPALAARVVMDGDTVVVRELVAGSLSRTTRVSRIDDSGMVTDIARAIDFGPWAVVPDRLGNIFVVIQVPQTGSEPIPWRMYRLSPLAPGETPAPEPSAAASVEPTAAASATDEWATGQVTPAVERIAFGVWSTEGDRSWIAVAGADGSGPELLIPGEHNGDFCQSADGSLIGFWSDREAAHEQFIHVANADGTDVRLVSEVSQTFWCGFSSELLPLVIGDTVSRYDLATGTITEVGDVGEPAALSPDGSTFASVVTRGDARDLELLDLAQGSTREIGPALAQTPVALTWSPDGTRLALSVDDDLIVVDTRDGTERTYADVPGDQLAWSSDGTSLLVWQGAEAEPLPGLSLVDVAGSSGVRQVTSEPVAFAGWDPTRPRYAWATPNALYVADRDGDAREAATPPEELCPDCRTRDGLPRGEWPWGSWMGWSPTGDLIGLGSFADALIVLDVETGAFTVVAKSPPVGIIAGAKWLR